MHDSSLDIGQQDKHNKGGNDCDYLKMKSKGFFLYWVTYTKFFKIMFK